MIRKKTNELFLLESSPVFNEQSVPKNLGMKNKKGSVHFSQYSSISL